MKSKSIVLPQYNDNLLRAMISLTVEERELPDLKPEEVLVKMEGAPCNPSDIAFLRGGYNILKPLPAVPGFEGTGRVVRTGNQAENLQGKRVSCFVQSHQNGTWAEYFIARKKDCYIVKDALEMEQAACFAINPMTAYALFEMIDKTGTKAIVQNAAAGQVARFIQFLAGQKKVEVINIVRKEAHIEQLKNKGATIVLNATDSQFDTSLTDACNSLQPLLAFDAVGGEMTGTLLNAMPAGGQVVLYGALSGGELSGINPMGVIFNGKKILGFNLNDWLYLQTPDAVQMIAEKIQDMFIKGKLNTAIQGTFSLDQATKGLRTYIKSMSAGKIIFTP